MDNMFIVMENPRTPAHICPVQIYDPSTAPGGELSFDQIVEAVRDCLPLAPTFRERLVRVPLDADLAYWIEDENFDLEYHMRHIALPKPGNWRQFCTQVGRLHSRPLDLSRPPWEMTVIDQLDSIESLPPGSFAIVFKIHHAAVDGGGGHPDHHGVA